MSRFVKVSAIARLGYTPEIVNDLSVFQSNTGADLERSLQRMITYLGHYLDQVAPDRPDLIALPEGFDRFPTHSSAVRRLLQGPRPSHPRLSLHLGT